MSTSAPTAAGGGLAEPGEGGSAAVRAEPRRGTPGSGTPASVPLGPQPARTDRPTDAALRVLRSLAATEEPRTIADLTGQLGGHPNSLRMHLEHLVSDGFAIEEPGPASGRGRPPRAYRATVAGRQVAGQDDGWDGGPALVAAVAEQLAGGHEPASAARELGRRWGRRLKHADADLVTTLAAQGFAPRVTEDGIELLTCPLLDTARQLPDVVCSIHQGLIDELSDQPLQLAPFARPGACVVRPAD
ncbi:MAG: hypothetical protein QM582_16115 [Micropruina sp.]|uniref:helix-turn-helix transcriptional regulator n=1 Tax=Micropruina sp. TaxID=2737536 RepID=UPI0039E57B78